MNKKVFIISLIILLFIIPSVMATYATFNHNSIKVSDGKDIDLNGVGIGNGSSIGSELTANPNNIVSVFAGTKTNTKIRLENGTFNLTNTLDISNYKNVTIEGSGQDSTILNIIGNIDGIAGTRINNIEIKNLKIIGGQQNGISFTEANHTKIHNIAITNASLKGIAFVSGSHNEVYQTYIYDNLAEAIVLAADTANNLPMTDYLIHDNTFINNSGYGGIGTITQTATIEITDVHFYNNFVNGAKGGIGQTNTIMYNGCFNCSATNNILIGGNGDVIFLGANAGQYRYVNNTVISGNIIRDIDTGKSAVRVQYGYNNTITDNKIFSKFGDIYLASGDYNIVWNNYNMKNSSYLWIVNGGSQANSNITRNYP